MSKCHRWLKKCKNFSASLSSLGHPNTYNLKKHQSNKSTFLFQCLGVTSHASIKFDLSNVRTSNAKFIQCHLGCQVERTVVPRTNSSRCKNTRCALDYIYTVLQQDHMAAAATAQQETRAARIQLQYIHSCNQNTRITTTGIYQAPPIQISLIIKLIMQNVPISEGKVLMGMIILIILYVHYRWNCIVKLWTSLYTTNNNKVKNPLSIW